MIDNGKPADPIADAIAATDDGPTSFPPMVEIPILIASTGRPAILALPVDVTATEISEVCAWALLNARAFVVRESRRPSIEIVRGSIPRA